MTPADLYSIAMESDTAYRHMETLCKLLGTSFPPSSIDKTQIGKGNSAPVTPEFETQEN